LAFCWELVADADVERVHGHEPFRYGDLLQGLSAGDLQAIPIEENRFGFEPEITVKIAKRRLRVYEVGISYWGRTYEEGKKIGWKDGVRAVYCLVKYSLKEPAVAAQAASLAESPARGRDTS